METAGIIEIIKLGITIGTPLAIVVWHLFKKLEFRIEALEKRASDAEKTIVKIETQLEFVVQILERIEHKIENK